MPASRFRGCLCSTSERFKVEMLLNGSEARDCDDGEQETMTRTIDDDDSGKEKNQEPGDERKTMKKEERRKREKEEKKGEKK
ncbi:hypothetical protein QVD17_12610 [Tagetes erecta]|uniref:Uncharacterized protein n=1 Tax=Tagetes erecta TaxID=13708 RepID=A0AAD8KV11_TARER|nr:hypothetical protein QVD17_12610 [Tagetes erecta]